MRYDVSESVRVERHEIDGVRSVAVKPGEQELADEEFALLEAHAPGVAVPVQPSRKQEK